MRVRTPVLRRRTAVLVAGVAAAVGLGSLTSCGLVMDAAAPAPTTTAPSSSGRPSTVSRSAPTSAPSSAAGSLGSAAAGASAPRPEVPKLSSALSLSLLTPDTPACEHLDRVLVGGEALLADASARSSTESLAEVVGALEALADELEGPDSPVARQLRDEVRSFQTGLTPGWAVADLRARIKEFVLQPGTAVGLVLEGGAASCGLGSDLDEDLPKLTADAIDAYAVRSGRSGS